jgi:hypothetical protein
VLVFFCTFSNACCPGLLGRGSKSARFFLHLAVYSASIFDLQMPFQPKGFFYVQGMQLLKSVEVCSVHFSVAL